MFLLVLIEAAMRRRKAEANPWGEGATTLEWTLSSPPPFHQFNELPVINADAPLGPRSAARLRGARIDTVRALRPFESIVAWP